MNLVFSDQALPSQVTKSLFLAGPSPRSLLEVDWRHEAVQLLAERGFDGTVFLPVPSYRFNANVQDGAAHGWSYDNQVEWEVQARKMADILVFWVPRVIDRTKADLGMPAFTTNFELGEDLHCGKVAYGRPDSAEKCKYLDKRVEEIGQPVHNDLRSLLEDAMGRLAQGALRTEGETRVPLFIWNSEPFQGWYANLRAAGNRLDDADLLNVVLFGGKHLFCFVLKVKVWVAQEQRHKSNEVVLARKDLSAVAAFYRDNTVTPGVTHLALVREFRSPVSNARGFVYELAGGSSNSAMAPEVNAQHELHEEMGLLISDLSRFKPVGVRQLAATFSTHRAHVYTVELTRAEFAQLQECAARGNAFGQTHDSERTYVELTTLEHVFTLPLDYSTLGMVYEASRVLGLPAT